MMKFINKLFGTQSKEENNMSEKLTLGLFWEVQEKDA